MKLLHLGDLHLGKTLGDFDLIKDQEYILKQIINIVDEKKIDGVLIAGDVYDKAIPSEAAIRLLDLTLSAFAKMGVKVYMISGNHDSDDRLNFGSTLFEANNIYISAIYDGQINCQVLTKGDISVNIYLLPFVKASQVKHFFPDEDIVTYEDAVRVILEKAQIDPDKINILLAHQFVTGKGMDPKLGGSEGSGTVNVGLVERIGYDLFDKFDYVALGHIHSPQPVGREAVRYSGSPLKYSLSEANNDKSVPIITINEDKKISIEIHPLKPFRDLRHIKGRMKVLLDKENVRSQEDYMYVTLTDEDIIEGAMGIVKQTYPYTVKLDYDNSHTHEIEQVDISQIANNRSFSDLIGDFYNLMYGCDISNEEMDLIKQAAEEAGIIDETN